MKDLPTEKAALPVIHLTYEDLLLRSERLVGHFFREVLITYADLGALDQNHIRSDKILLCREQLDQVAEERQDDDASVRNEVKAHAWAVIYGQAAMDRLPTKGDLPAAVLLYSKALNRTVKMGSIVDGWILLRFAAVAAYMLMVDTLKVKPSLCPVSESKG